MAIILPIAFLIVQALVLVASPSAISRPAGYIVMVIAPVLAAIAVVRRGLNDQTALRSGWLAVGVSLLIWALGAFGNLWHELVLGRLDDMYPDAMLAFNLAAMPIAFVLAGEGRIPTRPLARLIDALVATALSYLVFRFTWQTVAASGPPDTDSIAIMIWLLDALNCYIAAGALVRWYAADDHTERDLFGALLAYLVVSTVTIFINNHFIAGELKLSVEYSSVISVSFAVLAGCALAAPSFVLVSRAAPWVVRAVRSASPIMLVGGLLIVSLFMIRIDYPLGTASVLLSVFGYGVRTTLSQVRSLEQGENLQKERIELQSIALTDALTGIANRRMLEQSLTQASRSDQRGPLAVLMIDIDFFKLLNDHAGHPAGDACLRQVATALQRAVRPGDLLARYGGEEFVALVHGADWAAAAIVAERLRSAVEKLRIAHPKSSFEVVTVSIGIASALRENAAATAKLVETADQALYEAKRSGRNRVVALPAAN